MWVDKLKIGDVTIDRCIESPATPDAEVVARCVGGAMLADERTLTLVEARPRAEVLAQLERANRALLEAEYLDEVCAVRDAAEALRYVLKEARMSLEAQNRAAEIRIRAERRAGGMLWEMERGMTGPKLPDIVSGNSEYQQALEDTGLNDRAAQRWQMAAKIPERARN